MVMRTAKPAYSLLANQKPSDSLSVDKKVPPFSHICLGHQKKHGVGIN